MYYFALRPEVSHLGLYLLDYSFDSNNPIVSVALNNGRIVMFPEFTAVGAIGNNWPCISFSKEEQEKPYTNENIAIPKSFNMGHLYDQCILIEATLEEVSKLRNFFSLCTMMNEVLGSDCPSKVGCAPFYHGKGYSSDGVLVIDQEKEMRGRKPIDIRGNGDILTSDMNVTVLSQHLSNSITQSFAEEAIGSVPLARTNCVTFATALLNLYCGIDLEKLFPGLTKVTNSDIVNTLLMEFHSQILKADRNETKGIKIHGRLVISARDLKSFDEIINVTREHKSKTPIHTPALG